ncbi:acyl-CoA dehydrogenase family protein [Pseudonocardia sp. ICBG601]|uniref:acyl-CoA dehydrogenase family protein n=1 Tax=Pseudonocardia sp. ICBG601 TaxID=2846759 RepID=UPI001CF6BF4D|nr:acyl-CoA dehydrogenase family protein [Pseudonocardia sp. ICBG601]
MAVDLAQDADVRDLAERTARFIREVVIPVEETHGGVLPSEEARVQLQDAARAAGVFAPHASPELGGHGLDMRARAAVFEEAGYSLLGPIALNIAAPTRATCTCWSGSRARSRRSATSPRWPPATSGPASR